MNICNKRSEMTTGQILAGLMLYELVHEVLQFDTKHSCLWYRKHKLSKVHFQCEDTLVIMGLKAGS